MNFMEYRPNTLVDYNHNDCVLNAMFYFAIELEKEKDKFNRQNKRRLELIQMKWCNDGVLPWQRLQELSNLTDSVTKLLHSVKTLETKIDSLRDTLHV